MSKWWCVKCGEAFEEEDAGWVDVDPTGECGEVVIACHKCWANILDDEKEAPVRVVIQVGEGEGEG